MKRIETIKTIDLWTELTNNQYECFNGAFIDGFQSNKKPFDKYKIVRNCNCIITTNNKNMNIRNKHHAIVFYLNQKPVRLVVANALTDIDNCIAVALSQRFQGQKLAEVYKDMNITLSVIDLKQKPISNQCDASKEVDVGSCDRWSLLYNMLKGSYTEDATPYGNYESDQYEFIPELLIRYELTTDTEKFEIEHKCAFINTLKTRIVPIQENSPLVTIKA